MATLSRRSFLRGCSAAIAALAGARLTHLAFAADPTAAANVTHDTLIVVFLRGGWDALNVVPPIAGSDQGFYNTARPYLKIPSSGAGAALPLNAQFGLHPSLAPLLPLYQAGKMAIVHAAGLEYDTRSHFDAMQFIELGTPGVKTTTDGWISRHLQTVPNLPPSLVIPAMSAGSALAMSLYGTPEAIAMTDPSSFSFAGHWQYETAQRAALRDMYAGSSWLETAGTRTLDMVDLIETLAPGNYTPANGAVYPTTSFGDNLQAIAQLIKMDLGLRVATIDLGGWDTHEYQGDGSGGYFANTQLAPLGQGLSALYTDLSNASCLLDYTRRLTVVVMSEFGRRLTENANHGTDHGHGSVMFVLGGQVNGGQIYGPWPGLANAQLYDGADLAVTTDYRQVLSEIVTTRLGNPNLSAVFPGYTGYQPLGIIKGSGSITPPPPAGPYRLYLPSVNREEVCS